MKTRREILPVDSKVRTLRPSEMNALIDAAGSVKPSNAVRLMTLLLTGMRYMEAVRLHDHSDWFDGNFVWLPGEAQLKAMSNQKERYIRLSRLGKEMLPLFFDVKNLPSFETWREDLESWSARAGLDPVGVGPKTTRKTWESWLVISHPERVLEVVKSQGHTTTTSLQYYLNMPFLQTDKELMKPWVDGFF